MLTSLGKVTTVAPAGFFLISFFFFFLYIFTIVLSHWDFSHGKFGLPSPGRAGCNRFTLPNLRCMRDVFGHVIWTTPSKTWPWIEWIDLQLCDHPVLPTWSIWVAYLVKTKQAPCRATQSFYDKCGFFCNRFFVVVVAGGDVMGDVWTCMKNHVNC